MQSSLVQKQLNNSQQCSNATRRRSSSGTTHTVTASCRRPHRLDPKEDDIWRRVHEGAPLTQVARELGETIDAVYYWVMLDENRRTLLAQARKASAAAMVDETLEIANNSLFPVEDRKLKIQTRQWIASRTDREAWGEQQKAAVEVNIDILGVLREVKQQIIDITP